MNKLFKVLAIVTGAYLLVDFGALLGSGGMVQLYERPESAASEFMEDHGVYDGAKLANKIMFRQ